ncbi:MAG: S-layer protein [Chloroflexi bacterium]|nr:MAG: S-layer protein [Chloroflexota bacterium]
MPVRTDRGMIMRRAHVVLWPVLALVLLPLALRTAPAAAIQENDPEIVAALQKINLYRSWLGIPPLTIDPALQAAAEAHVEYYRLNFGDPSLAGMGLHYETPGKPGFTGVSFQDRVEHFGYKGYANENAGVSGSIVWSTDWFIATVGHRLTLLDPRYVHVGLAAINEGKIKFEIIDLGAPTWAYETTPEWTAWPPDGATGVGLSFSGEAPDPFPDADYPVGYPITLKYFGPGDLTLTDWSISAGGVAIDSFAEIGSGWLTRKTVQLCAADPLERDTVYEVWISGTANGEPFERSWSFRTTTGNDELALNGQRPIAPIIVPQEHLPEGIKATEPVVQQLWWNSDGPVATGDIVRSWLWGPDVWLGIREPSAESPDGTRQVYYLDKARIEVNPAADGFSHPTVTAGLLVRDMIAGQVQVGIDDFIETEPAVVQLAGDDLKVNPDAPTYASLHEIASIEPGRSVRARHGAAIIEVLTAEGAIYTDPALAGYATYGSYEPTLGHNIAAVFDNYFTTLPVAWQTSVGLPLTEPYWVRTNLEGDPTWVLVQAFERRVLTFTPDNDPAWRVEMGNIGRHYYTWRYNAEPPSDPSAWIP